MWIYPTIFRTNSIVLISFTCRLLALNFMHEIKETSYVSGSQAVNCHLLVNVFCNHCFWSCHFVWTFILLCYLWHNIVITHGVWLYTGSWGCSDFIFFGVHWWRWKRERYFWTHVLGHGWLWLRICFTGARSRSWLASFRLIPTMPTRLTGTCDSLPSVQLCPVDITWRSPWVGIGSYQDDCSQHGMDSVLWRLSLDLTEWLQWWSWSQYSTADMIATLPG